MTVQEIKEALRKYLSRDLWEVADILAEIVVNSTKDTPETSKNTVPPSEDELGSVINALAGREIVLAESHSIISFGCGNQIGDITIRDVAGRDIVHVAINITLPPITPIQNTYSNTYRLDYNLGLSKLREMVKDKPGIAEDFNVLEARLKENLRDESIFGTSENLRSDRMRIIYALNELSNKVPLPTSFTDLCKL